MEFEGRNQFPFSREHPFQDISLENPFMFFLELDAVNFFYPRKMIQGSKLADKAVVKFSNDYPLRLEYTVLNKMQLAFILAPRVDND